MLDYGLTAKTRILVVRLGAFGDILHALPAVASLKHSYPESRLTWAVEPRWTPLLHGNPFVDRIVEVRRGSLSDFAGTLRELRAEPYDFAVDFQGLLKSGVTASLARPGRLFGFHRSQLREPLAGIFYSCQTASPSAHVVDRNLDLAASAGAATLLRTFPLPPGAPDGDLPPDGYILASPLAGWRSKQWPIEHYTALAERLRRELSLPLVLNGPSAESLPAIPDAVPHISGLAGLIHATRHATAVIGVDSGPLHLAAALGKSGVAIFGPTDPARNGPYCDSIRVLRSASAVTSYKRGESIDAAMYDISPDQAFEALRTALRCLV